MQPSNHEHFLGKNQTPTRPISSIENNNIIDAQLQEGPVFSSQKTRMDYVTLEGIENVGLLTADQLIAISRKLFKLVKFCDCIRIKSVQRKDGKFQETAYHQCHKFNHHDSQHLTCCKCCQTLAFAYYLAWYLYNMIYKPLLGF
jgi:hypothetical protein